MGYNQGIIIDTKWSFHLVYLKDKYHFSYEPIPGLKEKLFELSVSS